MGLGHVREGGGCVVQSAAEQQLIDHRDGFRAGNRSFRSESSIAVALYNAEAIELFDRKPSRGIPNIRKVCFCKASLCGPIHFQNTGNDESQFFSGDGFIGCKGSIRVSVDEVVLLHGLDIIGSPVLGGYIGEDLCPGC